MGPGGKLEKQVREKVESGTHEQLYVVATMELLGRLPCADCVRKVLLLMRGTECCGVACPKGSQKGLWVFVPLAFTERCEGKRAPSGS
jgi:hypothetical protein